MSSLPRRAELARLQFKSYSLSPVAELACDFPIDVAQAFLPGDSGSELVMSWE